MLRKFTKTNAFELTIVFCIQMKIAFSSVVTPLSHAPKQCCKTVDVYLFPTLIKGEEEATFHEATEENLHQGKRLLIFCLNNFCFNGSSTHVTLRSFKVAEHSFRTVSGVV